LLIRPQRATVVRKISLDEVATSRFIRLSVELEVSRRACANFSAGHEADFRRNLSDQLEMIESGVLDGFGKLDARFHQLICEVAEKPEVFSFIADQKAKVDRLCALSLNNEKECREVYNDHEQLLGYLIEKDEKAYIAKLRSHLSRLDATIEEVSKTHDHFIE
jgi:GntR family transcriptional regulator, rspAB operon transcriptional repressor